MVERALNLNTHSVLLAHNHPSGDPTPSKADVNVTQIIVNALAGVDIPVIDHIIAAGRKPLDSLSMGYLNLRRRTAMPALRSCIDSEAAGNKECRCICNKCRRYRIKKYIILKTKAESSFLRA